MNDDLAPEIKITTPLIPDLARYTPLLAGIWDRQHLTNNGPLQQELERELELFLGLEKGRLALVSNGTIAITLALWALGISEGEVITTPFTFVATADAISAAGCTPVFADIDPKSMALSPNSAEKKITKRTVAILPVPVYGRACDFAGFEKISTQYKIPIIYDAAHTFGAKQEGKALSSFGDISTLSFHATKVFSTVEGGAVVCKDCETSDKVRQLRNFALDGKGNVASVGTNAKLSEIHAAYGLATLPLVEKAIDKRIAIAKTYHAGLRGIKGVSCFDPEAIPEWNGAYFPIFIDQDMSGISRSDLHIALAKSGIESREYFAPLINQMAPFASSIQEVPHAHKAAESVLCIPLHHELSDGEVKKILEVIRKAYISSKREVE